MFGHGKGVGQRKSALRYRCDLARIAVMSDYPNGNLHPACFSAPDQTTAVKRLFRAGRYIFFVNV